MTRTSRKNQVSKRIKNIINYRNYIGGFSKLNQIKKVYGFNEADYYVLIPHLKLGKLNMQKPKSFKKTINSTYSSVTHDGHTHTKGKAIINNSNKYLISIFIMF